MRIGFIGAGKVGFTLGKYFVTHGIRVTGYYSRDTGSAKEAAEFTDSKLFTDKQELVSNCDALFLTVPDGVITEVYDELKCLDIKGKMICHTSGALSSEEAFPGIKDFGAYGFSVHPLFAVSDKYKAYKELDDVFFAIEGDAKGISEIEEILVRAGLTVKRMEPANKPRYHLAACVTANLAVALMDEGLSILRSCGFSDEEARTAIGPLVMDNMRHILADGPEKALTGPVERNDISTVKKHLNALDTDEEKKLYSVLSQRLVKIAESRHPERSYAEMMSILQNAE